MTSKDIQNQLKDMIKMWETSPDQIYDDSDETYTRPRKNRSADSLVKAIRNGSQNFTPASKTDYGFDMFSEAQQETFRCYQIAVLKDKVTADQLHEACISKNLNGLLAKCKNVVKSESYKKLQEKGGVKTAWDNM